MKMRLLLIPVLLIGVAMMNISPSALAAPLVQGTASPEAAVGGMVIKFLDKDRPTEIIYYGPDEYLEGMNPLTGLVVANPELLDRRPMAIKVTNHPRTVRPQPGLTRADVVYEYYMERGISRFIAVYYGEDAEKVGPVRSGRFFDEHIFEMYDAIFAFDSADTHVMSYFINKGPETYLQFAIEGGIDERRTCNAGVSYPLCRDPQVKDNNDLVADTRALGPAMVARGDHNNTPDLSGTLFSPTAPRGGTAADTLFFRYSLLIYGKWTYSMEDGRYYREQEQIGFADERREEYAPLMDSLTGEQVATDNVVALYATHRYFIISPTTEIVQIDLIDSGEAVVFRDGLSYPAIWYRPPDGGVLQILDREGEPFPLKPGNTFYQVLSWESVLMQEDAEWRFRFYAPEIPDEPIYPSYFNPE
jgi:hypothetical protein